MNRLADETSPYLQQHKENPVDWYPWGDDAFARARAEDRPVMLSVGYSSCHWCHVMAHESFEDDDTAAVMNELFVNVKVDREERPDVDAVYMEAVQTMTGHGGWPMTVFLTPEGRPFFGGTYFPKRSRGGLPGFVDLCRAVDDAWKNRRHELENQAGELTEVLRRTALLSAEDGALPGPEVLGEAAAALRRQFDEQWGGFGRAPKFPQSMSHDLLLRVHARTGEDDVLEVVTTSLDAMASGGMYDHLGGGFHRYSVDAFWMVPHFEKMLYDQALLARAYLHAWQVTGQARYLQVLQETVGYVLRDLAHDDGGFYSAEDADSEGEEGRFYVWRPEEMAEVLGDDAPGAIEWYGVTKAGNFEGANILHRPVRGDLVRPDEVQRSRARLLEAPWPPGAARPGRQGAHRVERPVPGHPGRGGGGHRRRGVGGGGRGQRRVPAARAAGRGRAVAAVLAGGPGPPPGLRRRPRRGGGRLHPAGRAHRRGPVGARGRAARPMPCSSCSGTTSGAACSPPAATPRPSSPAPRTCWTTPPPRPTRRRRWPWPASAPSPATSPYEERAADIVALLATPATTHPTAFAHLLAALDLLTGGTTEVAVVGDRPDLVQAVRRRFLPDAVLAWGERYDSPLWQGREDGRAYVCRDYACQQPVTDVLALEAQLDAA